MIKKLKILHLEDLNTDVKLVDDILKKENFDFESLVVDSKDKFINALKVFSPDIILAENFLPSFNSNDALTLLQETCLKIPFIIVTGHVSEEFEVDIIKKGADDYIFKDRPNRLPAAINNALEKFIREKEREQMMYDQAHLAAIVHASNNGIISKTLDGIITSWNLSAEKLFGYSAAEAIGKNISIIIPPEHLQEESDFIECIKRKESVQHFETVRITKNGKRVNVSLTISPLIDNNGKVIGAAKIVYDITEKKKTEEKLQQSEQKYRTIAHEMQMESARLIEAQAVAKVGSWEIDLPGFQITWSEETHRIFETEPHNFLLSRSTFVELIYPEDRVKVDEALTASFNGLSTNALEYRIISAKGNLKFVEEHWKIFHNNEGEPIRVAGTCQDITDRKKTQQEIHEKCSQLHILTNNMPDTLMFQVVRELTGETKFTYISSSVQQLTGKTAEEVMQDPSILHNTIHEDDRQKVAEAEEASYRNMTPFDEVVRNRNFKGEPGWVHVRSVPRKLADGTVISDGVCNNITERKKAEQELKDSNFRFEMISRATNDALWEWNFETGKLWANETHQQLYGLTLADPAPTLGAWKERIHPEDRDAIVALQNSDLASDKNIFISEYRFLNGNKEYRNIYDRCYIIRNKEGKAVGMVGSILDITDRKKAENKLNVTSNELALALADLKKIMDSSVDIICTISEEGKFVTISAACERVWGYTPGELIGRKYMDFVLTEYSNITQIVNDEIRNGEPVTMFENKYVHKDGRIIPMLWSSRWDDNDQLFYSIAKDATEKKRLEKAIENERNQFFDMFSKAPSAIGMLKGADHVFEMANPLYLQLSGKKDVVGKTVAEVLPEVIEQGFIAMLDHVYHTGETVIGKETLVKVDTEGNGELTDLYMNFIYQAYRNGKGEIEGVFFFINEITEQIVSRKKIEKSEKQYRQIVETAQEGIWMFDELNRTTFVNQKLCEILEYSKDEMLVKDIYYFMDEESKQIAEKLMQDKQKGLKGRDDFKYISKSGKEIWTSISTNPIFDDEGKYIGALAMLSDITERKKADEEIRFKANLLNTIGQGVIGTDMDGIVNYWNQAAENIYGWTKEEALGQYIINLTTSEATHEQGMQIMEDRKKGQTWSGEFKVHRKDGTNFPALVTNSPIYDEHNNLSGIIGISTDITEKKKLEALLDKSNQLARIGSWEIDLINNTLYWSPITKQIHGVAVDFIPDVEIAIGLYKEGSSREAITHAINAAMQKGNPFDLEVQIVTMENIDCWVRAIGEAEMVNGKFVRVYGSFQDIDERKKAEIEILKAYEEKNIILESIGDGFYALDKDWVITYWNKQAEIILKKSRQEVIGKNIWELYPYAKNSISYTNYHNAVEEKTIQHYERFNEEFNLWLEISAYPSSTGLSVFFKDITDRKISEKQLGELNVNLKKHASDLAISNKELEAFAYVASHDLQEPLRMVTGFLAQLEKKYSDVIDDKGKQYIHFAVDGAKRMRQIILDLLEFSRTGRIEDAANNIDLNDIVREVILLCQTQVKETKATVRFENLPSLVTHHTSLRQVFQNLVSNALKYHVKGRLPVITISAEEHETHWQFAIGDNGIGIEADYFDKIFVIFQRLHNKDEYSGTGIGLAVCKKIIENLGGKIWLTSVPEKGTTFYFTIPKK